MQVLLEDIPVMYVTSKNGHEGAAEAFKKLERTLGWENWETDTRRFYGTMFNDEYRACAAIEEGDYPDKYGLKTMIIPGGKYRREILENWEEYITDVSGWFETMQVGVALDSTRPRVEFYSSQTELFLLLPIK